MYGVIYKITNLINKKVYVGQTTVKPQKRFNQHINDSKNNPKKSIIAQAIKKYGVENFSFEVILECYSQEELNSKETEQILLYKKQKLSYNKESIANKVPLSEDAKRNIQQHANSDINKRLRSKIGKNNRGRKLNGSSKFHGVSKKNNNWVATVTHNNITIYLGTYYTENEAAQARDIFDITNNYKNELNFPELYEKYLNNEIIPNKILKGSRIHKNKKTNCKIVGISYSEQRKRWAVQLKGIPKKRFKTLEEAEKYLINFKKVDC
jgi:group I intron endonuclease